MKKNCITSLQVPAVSLEFFQRELTKKVIEMTEQEFINNEVQVKLARQDEKFNAIMARIDATNEKVDNLISEMRDRDNRRADEITEIRNDIKEIYKTTDAKVETIRATIDSTNKHIRNLSYASIGAIAAMVITVLLNLPK